jgi:hypothetical protein
MLGCEVRGALRRGQRFSDAHDGKRSGGSRSLHDETAVGIECGIGEMRVAVDEVDHRSTNRRATAAVRDVQVSAS